MFTKVSKDQLADFRLIYHQTTGYSNPIIETVLYQDRGGNGMYYFGDLIDGNYFIFHRSGFCHMNFNIFENYINDSILKEIDSFLQLNIDVPKFLLFYNTPLKLIEYFKKVDKKYLKLRKRRRYQIDENRFLKIDENRYSIPQNHKLVKIQDCPIKDLNLFNLSLDKKFYNSYNDFFENSFGFVLYNENSLPMSISYLICKVGRNSECDLLTLPEYRQLGYGYICITNYVKESIKRKIEVGWDCFVDNHTNEWVKEYGYTKIIREYDFITFLNKP